MRIFAREGIVGILRLGPGGLVLKVGALKRLDDAACKRGLPAAPEVPHPVEVGLTALLPGATAQGVDPIEQEPAGARHARTAVYLGKRTILVHGDTAVEEQQVAVDLVD